MESSKRAYWRIFYNKLFRISREIHGKTDSINIMLKKKRVIINLTWEYLQEFILAIYLDPLSLLLFTIRKWNDFAYST